MIEVQNLTKRFGQLTAVDNMSFRVGEGEAVALWGANGAGKTTVLHCILSLVPFEGSITVAGMEIPRHGKAARSLLGFVPQALSFHDEMSVEETMTFYATLKKVKRGNDFTPLLSRLDLTAHTQKPVGSLSGGLKQRLALALALISDPPLLLLDEPTSNLDITSRESFLALLSQLKSEGKTLLFTSHRIDEVTALANRVLLLETGKLVIDAPPAELGQQLGRPITLYLYIPKQGINSAIETITRHGFTASVNGQGLRVNVEPGQKGRVMHLLHEAGVNVSDFTVE